MKLDRNVNPDGKGKYALILQRKNPFLGVSSIGGQKCFNVAQDAVDYGDTRETEFFVIRLKDKYASAALNAYALAAMQDDWEWANEIRLLAIRSANNSDSKIPD